jgi:N-acetyltransferase
VRVEHEITLRGFGLRLEPLARTHVTALADMLCATREGTLRGHRVDPVGERSDTVYFSILASQWPTVRAGLLERLA